MPLSEKVLQLKQDFDEVFDAGKQAEYDAFWDTYQQNGERTDYSNAFVGDGWSNETLRPKHPCKVIIGTNMFANCHFNHNYPTDDLIDVSHVTIDMSEATHANSMYNNAMVNEATLICSESMLYMGSAFNKGSRGNVLGMNITLLVPNPNCDWTNAFAYHRVRSLNLLSGTVIGRNGFDVRWAGGLSQANIRSIIAALSPDTSGLTVTLSKVAVDREFETSEGANDGSSSAEWLALVDARPNWSVLLV